MASVSTEIQTLIVTLKDAQGVSVSFTISIPHKQTLNASQLGIGKNCSAV